MTQRNPLNERYTAEDRKGATRKSAASAKPVSKAAASVRMQPTEKTKEQKKADRKAERAKTQARDRQFYNPPTEEYKRLRRIWWIMLVAAIVLTCFSFAGNSFGLPQPVTYVTLALAYVFIIGALYVDFAKCRKARQKYAEEVMKHPTKEMRAAEKKAKAEKLAAEKRVKSPEEVEAARKEAEEKGKKALFGGLFKKKDKQ